MSRYKKDTAYNAGDIVWCEIKGFPCMVLSGPNNKANYKTLEIGKDCAQVKKSIFYVDRSWKVGNIENLDIFKGLMD